MVQALPTGDIGVCDNIKLKHLQTIKLKVLFIL